MDLPTKSTTAISNTEIKIKTKAILRPMKCHFQRIPKTSLKHHYMLVYVCFLFISSMWSMIAIYSFQISNLPAITYNTKRGSSINKKSNRNQNSFSRSRYFCPYFASIKKSSNDPNNNYSRDLTDRIKDEVDIISVVESHNLPQFSRLSVDRATAICPFHNDNNPSLTIDKNKGLYKCFSCGAGGDIFNFEREYDYLSKNTKNQADKMSFPTAVIKIANEFCSQQTQQEVGRLFRTNANNEQYKKSKMSKEQLQKLEMQNQKKERILLANSVAADFYAKSLITSNSAGSARSHLFQRGIAPSQVRTFALGYAPDSYFSRSNEWGKGSLVERLREMEFEPKEIVEAGLATVTTAAKNRIQSFRSFNSISSIEMESTKIDTTAVKSNSTATAPKIMNGDRGMSDGELQYTDLMDRFRGRLMVPIFDSSGKKVLGFGGRDLDEAKTSGQNIEKTSNETKQTFKSPKYLNSPESLVFEKKNVLFGLNSAKFALEDKKEKELEAFEIKDGDGLQVSSFFDEKTSILIVEGYFDAIALHGADIPEVTASMGSALTSNQLEAAAKSLGQGRILLCLDNDDAGIGAVERLCSGPYIWNLVGKITSVEIAVCDLPLGIKDPAEFVESRAGNATKTVKECFQSEVIDNAVLWYEWFIDRLIQKYDQNDPSSFGNVCEEITDFLSNNSNPADRTKQAYEVATKLARQISGNDDADPSVSLRIQLETDLLGMASKKASRRETYEKRKEAVRQLENIESKRIRQPLSVQNQAVGLGQKRFNATKTNMHKGAAIDVGKTNERNPYASQSKVPRKNQNKQYNTSLNRGRNNSPIAGHFHGFTFSPSDAAWLGVSNSGSNEDNLILGNDGKVPKWKRRKQNVVYFNSNEYLGNDVRNVARQASANLVSTNILNQDGDKLLLGAEFRLLKAMVQFSTARHAMKAALLNRDKNAPALIEWSIPEREWLFHCLTESPGHEPLPQELLKGESIAHLKNYFENRTDVPNGAFAAQNRNQTKCDSYIDGATRFDSAVVDDFVNSKKESYARKGTLDVFFDESDDVINVSLDEYSPSHNERAELTVQEAVATMLKASALKRLNSFKYEWSNASDAFAKRQVLTNETLTGLEQEQGIISTYANLNDAELKIKCNDLGNEVVDAMNVVTELSESLKQLSRRLLDYCSSDGTEGKNSEAKQKELAHMLEVHIASLPDDRDKPGYSDDYVFGSDQFRDDIDTRYGGIPSQSNDNQSQNASNFNISDDESIFQSVFE